MIITKKKMKMVQMLAQGYSVRESAKRLDISEDYFSEVLGKLYKDFDLKGRDGLMDLYHSGKIKSLK